MRDAIIHLRAHPEQRDLIDQAALLAGKTRSDFMLEVARSDLRRGLAAVRARHAIAETNLSLNLCGLALLSVRRLCAWGLSEFLLQIFHRSRHGFHVIRQMIYFLFKSFCLLFLPLQLFKDVSKLIIVH